MAENDDNRPQRFKALQSLVKDQRSLLTEDQGVPGTDISLWRLRDLSQQYDEFGKVCLKQLEQANSCSTVFNVAGKKLEVEVSLPKVDAGADKVSIKITNEETGAKRKATFSKTQSQGL
jgi:hypothetical protein